MTVGKRLQTGCISGAGVEGVKGCHFQLTLSVFLFMKMFRKFNLRLS